MESHHLTEEFAENAEKINQLKAADPAFLQLYVNYEEVNDLIRHYEENGENHTTDEHLTDLRKKRLHLKDELYARLHG